MARAKKFGAFGGVFTPSILTILGVIMFLRLPWIVGQAGLWSSLAIILVAHIISASTGLSVASVATDKRVETGGTYFIISRSLGLPIGGTLGLALFVGLSFSVSLYLIGFSEAFLSYFGFEVSLPTIRITGSIILALVALITLISTSLAIKTQYLIMAAMALSLISVFLGSHEMTPVHSQLGSLRSALPWISLFAIFFPAVTGFEAGVSMSGDLKNPRKAIPLGTISAIVVGLLVYIGLALFFSLTVDRDQLITNPAILFDISFLPQLVIAGILGATLSSALGSILGAPRILQAVAADRILPPFFAKGHGPSREPRNALLLTFVIAQAGILIGELNVIARIVTIFFIITYGFLNITYAVESWAGSDFRPSFRIPRMVSIVGALACIIIMIQLDVLAMIGASLVLIFLFLFLKKKELTLQTGDTWNSIWASLVKTGLGRLASSSRKPRNWRPNVILFSGGHQSRPYLVDMGKALVGRLGIFTNFELMENPSDEILLRKDEQIIPDQATGRQRVFTRRHTCRDIYEGIDSISKIYGFSGFEPNTILMGWARRTRDPVKFAHLLGNFKKLDYNLVFLNYDHQAGFGNYRQIDFWWSGSGRNLSLALTLMRFITSSNEWRSACLRILVIIRDNSLAESYYRLINQLLDNYRMTARVKVISNGVEQLAHSTIIHNESSQTDLTMLELPPGGARESEQIISQANQLTMNLGTSLILQASSFFEEVGIARLPETSGPLEEEQEEQDQEKPALEVAEWMQQLQVSPHELIANEVYNLSQLHALHARKYYDQALDPARKRKAEFYLELHEFTSLASASLLKAFSAPSFQEQEKEILRLLNDFSYHSQRKIKEFKLGLMKFEKELMEQALSQYLSVLRHSLSVVPDSIRIRLTRQDFRIMPSDSLPIRLYKIRKQLQATLTGKPVLHKIKVTPAARYYLFLRRLQWVKQLLKEFALYSFREVSGIRKILTELHQIIESGSIDTRQKYKAIERVKMERNRLLANISVMQNESRDFYRKACFNLFEQLGNDLQQFNDYLDNPGMKPPELQDASPDKSTSQLQEFIEDFPGLWERNLDQFINKGMLEFLMLSLKNRLRSKTRKYKQEMKLELEAALLKPMRSYRIEESQGRLVVSDEDSRDGRLDAKLLKNPNLPLFFEPLYDEINALVEELPEEITIADAGIIEKIEEGRLEDAAWNTINLRSTVAFYLGTELIDKARRQTEEGQQQIQKILFSLKDLIRLVNFNLENDPELIGEIGEQQRQEQIRELMKSFHQRMRDEQSILIKIYRGIGHAFDMGIRNAFEPLTPALISKHNIASAKKKSEASQPGYGIMIRSRFRELRRQTQQQFVNLLYSKSEGMLWVSRYEREETNRRLSNHDFLDFAAALTPSAEAVKSLPHYYSSLFSGKSGVGEGFWVGMQAEVQAADQAIDRFRKGYSGAIIVTGERSSGKSSLCKLIAKKHFPASEVFSLRAPRSCNSQLQAFTDELLEVLGAAGRKPEEVLQSMAPEQVIIFNDIELWWERKPGGLDVIRYMQELIDRFGGKLLFLINCNIHALNILDQASDLRSYSLATITCRPFDARELKETILLRHQAGGLEFVLDNKPEARMSAWDYARLFNYYFDLSRGNPGSAITLWLASIRRISGKQLIMQTIKLPNTNVLDQLDQEQLFYILQFVIQRRLTALQLSEALQISPQTVSDNLRKLQRSAILIQRFEGVYALNRYLENHLVQKLKSLDLL